MEDGTVVTHQTIISGVTQFNNRTFYQERRDYVNGGITFVYGGFANIPNVRLGVELKDVAYSTGLIVSPIITNNSSASTTVRVNIGTVGGGIAEAATDDVTVSLYAVGV